MKILKEGIIPVKTRRFRCSNCGCIFECEEGEYELRFDQRDGYYCTAKCPTCRKKCYTPNHAYREVV